MAEEIKVTIGADTSQLRAQLTLAENDLKAFQLEIKRSTNVTDIAKLQNSITILTTKVATLKNTLATSGTGMDSLAGKSRGATSALTDLSRIAQDAPYGFMAISNNLNPMLESFQRLKMESGSTGGALKAMAASLAGPAGIGIALAVVSSAIVAYNKYAATTKEVTDDITESLRDAEKGAISHGMRLEALTKIITDSSASERDRNLALAEANKALEPYGQKIDSINVSVARAKELTDLYTEALINQAVGAKLADKVADLRIQKTDALNRLEAQKSTIIGAQAQRTKDAIALTGVQYGTSDRKALNYLQTTQNVATEQEKLVDINTDLVNIQKQLDNFTAQYNVTVAKSLTVDKEKVKTSKDKVKQAETERDVLKKLNEDMRDQQAISLAFDKSTLPEQMKLVEAAIVKLISDFNLSPDSDIIMGLKADVTKVPGQLKNLTDYNELLARVSADAYYEEYQKRLAQKEKNPQKDHKMKVVAPKLEMTELGKQIDDQLKQVNSALQSGLQNIIVGFAEALGAALSGDMGFGDFFKALFAQVGAGMQQFGKVMIGFAIKAELLKKWAVANPALAIAAGIGLIALGALIKNQTAKNAFAVGTRNAPGGLSLVGERGPELVNIPRGASVIPAAQTSNMMGGMGGAVEVFGVLRGQDIYFSNKKYGLSYGRQT